MMDIKIIETIEELCNYREQWKNLLLKIDNRSLYLELDWIEIWWKHFGRGNALYIICFLEGNRLRGVCPFMKTRKGYTRKIYFIGHPIANEMDFVFDPEFREVLADQLAGFLYHLKGPFIVHLRGFIESSQNFKFFKESISKRKTTHYTSQTKNYYLDIPKTEFADFCRERFGKERFQAIQRKEQRLKDIAPLYYQKLDASEMETAFVMHRGRWKHKFGKSSFSEGNAGAFFRELLENRELPFKSSLDVMRLGDHTISFLYTFQYKNNFVLKRIGHDDMFHQFNPGTQILHAKIRECFQMTGKTISFGIGENDYKRKWTDDCLTIHTLEYPSRHVAAKANHYLLCLFYRIRDAIRENRTMMKAVRAKAANLKHLASGEPFHVFQKNTAEMLHDCKQWIFSRGEYVVLEKHLSASADTPDTSLSIKGLKIEEIRTLAAFMQKNTDEIIRRLEEKNQCIIIRKSGIIVHCVWLHPSVIRIPKAPRQRTMKCGTVYLWEQYTGKNCGTKQENILTAIEHYLYHQGKKRICILTKANSRGSWLHVLGYKEKYSMSSFGKEQQK